MSASTTEALAPRPARWHTLVALWRLGRYRFLAGGFVLYALGAALARAVRPLSLPDYVLGQAAITATQLMTNYCNDYFDRETDAANPTPTTWSGGSRVLPEGALPASLARNVAIGLGALAAVLAAAIVARGHAAHGIGLLLFAILVLSWEYSAPPLRLHSHGLGPLTASLVVGACTPLVGYGAQGGLWSLVVLLAVVPVTIAQFGLILVLDFPDAEGDARTGKRTLVVQLGKGRAMAIAVLAVALTYLTLPLLVAAGLDGILALGVAASLPFGIALVVTLVRGEWRAGQKRTLAWRGVLWFVAVSAFELAAVIVERARER